jgi:hypothetical protein
VAVAIALLLMSKETLRQDQAQMILGARHPDIQKTALFLDLGAVACAEVRGYATVDRVENEDRPPFQTFGRMNGREN